MSTNPSSKQTDIQNAPHQSESQVNSDATAQASKMISNQSSAQVAIDTASSAESSQSRQPSKLSYKEFKEQTSKAVKDGIESGMGDEIAEFLRASIRTVLMAPYDIMNYSLLSFMLLSKSGRKKFYRITVGVAIVFSIVCAFLLVHEVNIAYAFYIVGALLACMLVLIGLTLNSATPSSKHTAHDDDSSDLGDLYIE